MLRVPQEPRPPLYVIQTQPQPYFFKLLESLAYGDQKF